MSLELPEHDKLKAIQPLSQAVYDFLEWCGEHGMTLCSLGEERGYRDYWFPITEGREKLLARHFEIDLDKLEREKQAIIDEMRAFNSAPQEAKR